MAEDFQIAFPGDGQRHFHMAGAGSVSYTHLDVYKRQNHTGIHASQQRFYISTGMLLEKTDGRSNTTIEMCIRDRLEITTAMRAME